MLAVRRAVVLLLAMLVLLMVLWMGEAALHLRRRGTQRFLVWLGPGRAMRRALLVVGALVHGDRDLLRRHLHGSGGGDRLDALAHERQAGVWQGLSTPALRGPFIPKRRSSGSCVWTGWTGCGTNPGAGAGRVGGRTGLGGGESVELRSRGRRPENSTKRGSAGWAHYCVEAPARADGVGACRRSSEGPGWVAVAAQGAQ